MKSCKAFCLTSESFFLMRKPKRVAVWPQSLAVIVNSLARNALRVASNHNMLAAIAERLARYPFSYFAGE